MRPRIYRRATLDAGDPRDDVTPTHAVDAHFEELVLRRRQQVGVALSSGKCTGALDSTDTKDQPLRCKAGAAANVFGAARCGYHQRDCNPGNFQAAAGRLNPHGIGPDRGEVRREGDSRGRTSAGRYRRLSDQRLERRRENDVVALEQSCGVANRYADAAGKDGQRILNKRGNGWTVVAGDAAL